MKVVLQRVSQASVEVEGACVGSIQKGYLLLVGVSQKDQEADALYLANKIAQLRVFADDQGKMNCSIFEVGGAILSISQFTLLANTKKGNRPSFVEAAQAEKGQALYEYFNQLLKERGLQVETGVFGADMAVSLVNDGPVTIVFDTENKG